MIYEDPFSLVVSINIAATDLRALLNAKKDGIFSLNAKIRKVWIPKQVHKDDLATRRRVSATKKWKRMKGIHTI